MYLFFFSLLIQIYKKKNRTNGPTNGSSLHHHHHHQMVSRKTLPHVVYCRIWRFADLQNCNELKSVPHCQYGYNHHQSMASTSNNNTQTANTTTPTTINNSSLLNPNNKSSGEDQMVCINPYHYTRVECNTHQHQLQQQPLTVYVPAKIQQQQQQQQQQHPMDTLMPSVGPLVGLGNDLGVHHDLFAPSYMQTNLHNSVNSPSPPPSASILSPSSIGKFYSSNNN